MARRGTHLEPPRGEPIVHHDLPLQLSAWPCPIAVEVDGVEPCLSLFGA